MTDTPYDVLIVGGGFAGLSAAALLSRQKRRVLLVEASARLGGRATYFERDGFVWQYGQHSHRLAHDGIAARVFNAIGDPIDFLDTRGGTAYLYLNGALYPRPEGAGAFLFTRLLPFTARLDFLRFYARLLKEEPGPWYGRTLLEYYRVRGRNPSVEKFLCFLGFAVMIPDPARVSAGEVIRFLQRAAKVPVKQGEPRGGSKQLIDKLRNCIRTHGGEIRTRERVREILSGGGRVLGVRTDLAEHRAGQVVFAAPLFHLFGLMPESLFQPAFVEYVKGIRSSSGVSIDFVFDGPVTEMTGGILGVDIPLWVKFQSNLDPTIAPPGRHVNTWAMLLEQGTPATPKNAEPVVARIKQIMEEVLPGAARRIVHERRLLLPVVNANMLIPEQSLPRRPAVACPDVEGLYFIGDTVQSEGCSGDIAFSSALQLAELL
ncbi:MAG: NAD(P)/FAD-dependent oxidoreductase [Candidatus Hydrogenedentes bacterium]|nr:NAD(P)/FAD-dependent oxidoreductase [Candidatus Hydrogenedentota bacterium]